VSANLHFGSSKMLCSIPSDSKEARNLILFPLNRSLFAATSLTVVSIGFAERSSGFDCANNILPEEAQAATTMSPKTIFVQLTSSPFGIEKLASAWRE